MALKDLTPEMLKKMQEVIALFEFYGMTEEDVASLHEMIVNYKTLDERLHKVEINQKNTEKAKTEMPSFAAVFGDRDRGQGDGY